MYSTIKDIILESTAKYEAYIIMDKTITHNKNSVASDNDVVEAMSKIKAYFKNKFNDKFAGIKSHDDEMLDISIYMVNFDAQEHLNSLKEIRAELKKIFKDISVAIVVR